jgi:hypothetical protein
MSIAQFSQFRDFLALAVNDVDFVRKNTALQDTTYLETVLARIEALTPDVMIRETYAEAISQMGVVKVDDASRSIKFVPYGFETKLSRYREATAGSPNSLFVYTGVSAGNVRYLLSDWSSTVEGNGVLLLNDRLEVLRRFPHFGANTIGGEYETASAALVVTIGDAEYCIIACNDHHCVQIYEWAPPYNNIATIGTVDVTGADSTHLNSPTCLAFEPGTSTLFIGCPVGQPAGATASNGFVARWDLTTPITPAFIDIPWFYAGTGSLLDTQVHTPTSLCYDGTYVWVVNGNDATVGAFSTSTPPLCVRYLEAAGPGYQLRTPQQVWVQALDGGYSRVYVANSLTGTVEEFDGVTFDHLTSYGIRANEDNIVGYTRLSPYLYGALGQPVGVVRDQVVIAGQTTNVMVVSDALNGRLHRFNLDAYETDNFVNFEEVQYGVPVVVSDWSLDGTVPIDLVHVWYRTDSTQQFRELLQGASTPASRTFQFRVSFELDPEKFVGEWYFKTLTISAAQV